MNEIWTLYEVVIVALTLWREARGESKETRTGIACSIRDRVRHPKWWGNDFVSVCTKKWQYTSMSGVGDPNLIQWPQASDAVFEECLQIASDVIHDVIVQSPVPCADSYYDVSIHPPVWATPDKRVGQLGKIVFYNIDGATDD